MTETCDVCQAEIEVGAWPFCPHGTPSLKVIQDSIPGGVWLENLDRTPIKVHSHSERRMEMAKRGLTDAVRHVGEPGSDKSRHTVRWT